MKSINQTVDKKLFPFSTSLISNKGLYREKIFHSELNFIHNNMFYFKLFHINMKNYEKYK